MTFPSRPKIGPKDQVVPVKCRSKGSCDSNQAVLRKLGPGKVQYICLNCGHVWGVNQGGAVNL